MIVDRIKVLYKQREQGMSEISDGVQRRLGNRYKATRRGLLCVMMGASQDTLDPLSPILSLFCLRLGMEGEKGRMLNVFSVGQAQAQAH